MAYGARFRVLLSSRVLAVTQLYHGTWFTSTPGLQVGLIPYKTASERCGFHRRPPRLPSIAAVPDAVSAWLQAAQHAPVMRGSAVKGSKRAFESEMAMEQRGWWLDEGFDDELMAI